MIQRSAAIRPALWLVTAMAAATIVATCPAPARAQVAGQAPEGIDPSGDAGSQRLPGGGTSIDPNPHADEPQGGGGGGGEDDKGPAPPPPTLPGSHTQPIVVAPADKTLADMDPSAALFDSINRGDIGGARQAIGRGASLDAHNVLGLTPIELAVDLHRNDISFLLLSMRSSGEAAPTGAASSATRVATRGGAARPTPASQTRSPVPAGAAPAPAPAAGFLGFGGS